VERPARRGTVRSHAWFHWAAHFFEAIKDVLGVEADVAKQSVDDARSDKLTDLVLEMGQKRPLYAGTKSAMPAGPVNSVRETT
jgi:hypothetical protein